jgi:polysaccharide export outer membrane protein
MMSRKFFIIFLLLSFQSYGQDRMGILLPENAQMQQAIRAAAKVADDPLEAPAIDITVPTELLAGSEETKSEIEKTVEEDLVPISLEEQIQNQSVQSQIEQFGYDIFSSAPSTFAPVDSLPVPPDYLIGPGDTFVIKIYGSLDIEYKLVVTREGQLLIPEIGDLQIGGLTFNEAKSVIQDEVNNSRVGARSIVTISDLHTIQVLMVGEVTRPGSYTVSGLSSLLNTLITTGGIKRSGSLRNIQVRRASENIANMDLYDLLLKGIDQSNIYLRQGDVVFVPPIGPTIGVAGEVKRPAIFELKQETSLKEIVDLAGGFLPKAAPQKSHIERISDKGTKTLVSVDLTNSKELNSGIKNGDLIRVFPVLDKMDDVVILAGHVLEPGGYQWANGMRISDVIRGNENLRQSVDYSIGLIQRENALKRRIESLYFDLGEILANPKNVGDFKLSPRDQITIFDTSSSRNNIVKSLVDKLKAQATAFEPEQTFTLAGTFKFNGTYPLPSSTRLLDATMIGGGVPPKTDLEYGLLLRENLETGQLQFIHINLRQAFLHPKSDHNPYLQARDKIFIFDDLIDRASLLNADIKRIKDQAVFGTPAPVVTVSGQSKNNGDFPLTPGMRIEDLITAAGGMKEKAFGTSGSLSRRQLINGEFSVIDNYEVRLAKETLDGFDKSLILQPYDYFVLREKPEWIAKPKIVSIEGEVLYPGQYQVEARETLCSIINRAGSFTEDAYLFGAVFLRESVRKQEQDALNKLFDEIDDTLVDVHLSPGFSKDTKLPVTQGTADTYKVIQKLQRYKANGRMVIDLEKAVEECSEEFDIVLEDGDKLIIPKMQNSVSVVGQVYHPQSHIFREDRATLDYVNLSGGTREFAQREHIYVYQANGEIMTIRSPLSSWGWALSPSNIKVTPGSTIYVPISIDRINGREFAQSWVDLFFKTVVSISSLDYLLN